MFGSITNWVSETSQQVQATANQAVDNVKSSMPPVPSMPSGVPEMFTGKKGETSATELVEKKEGDEEQPKADSASSPAVSADTETKKNSTETTSAAATPAGAEGEESATTPKEPASGGTTATATAEGDAESSANMQNKINVEAQKALGNAKEIGSNLGSMFMSFGSKATASVFSASEKASASVMSASENAMKQASHLKEVIGKGNLIGEFTKENEEFVKNNEDKKKREEAPVPPWVGYNGDEEKLKLEILELSTDSRNFIRTPPPGVEFTFDYEVAHPIALATLEEDENLKEMRFKLVPGKMSEEQFWKNYFYRVQLIRQSNQLDELNKSQTEQSATMSTTGDEKKTAVETEQESSSAAPVNTEFVSDDLNEISADEMNKDLNQLNLNKKAPNTDDPDWEKELPEDMDNISAEELEKEINEMISK